MPIVILTNSALEGIVSDEDFDLILLTWQLDKKGYIRRSGCTEMHKVIAKRMNLHGEIDHEDRNRRNNCRNNLRLATRTETSQNRTPALPGFKGVSYRYYPTGRCWHAIVVVNKRRISLGYYHSSEEAAKAYDKAALKYFGKFASINFPKEKE